MPIRCITFDLDDTLWDVLPVINRAEETFHGWLSEHYPRITQRYDLQALIAHKRDWFAGFPDLHHDLTTLRKRWIGSIAKEAGYDEGPVEPGFQVFWHARNQVALYDDVLATLDRLKLRYSLGAITNGNADLDHIGIGHYFDFVITAAGVGVTKPHPRIFVAALDEAGTLAADTLHVGDDPVRDVAGAANVGMRTLWFNPRAEPPPPGCCPDGVVRTVAEVVEWVEGMDKG